MKKFKTEKKVVNWKSYFITSSGEVHSFTFTEQKYAESLMCMFLAAEKCSWVEKEEKYVWFNTEYMEDG